MFKHSRDDLIRLLFHGNPSEGTSNLNKGLQHRTAAEKDARNRLTVGAQYRVKKIIVKIFKFLFLFRLEFITNFNGTNVCITSSIYALS